MSRARRLLRLLPEVAAPPEDAGGDAWWRGCLLRARAINAALPVKCAVTPPTGRAAGREAERRRAVEDFLKKSSNGS